MVKFAIVAVVLSSCGYNADLADCAATCSPTNTCPSNLMCVDGLCRTSSSPSMSCEAVIPSGDATSDGVLGSDAAVAIDAPTVDAAAVMITLGSPTASDVGGGSPRCPDPTMTAQTFTYRWFRVFRPSEWGVPGTFHANATHFTYFQTIGTQNVTVTLWDYSGSDSPASITSSELTNPVTMTVGASPGTGPLVVTTPKDVLAGDAFAIEIDGSDAYSAVGSLIKSFHVATSSAAPPPNSAYFFFESCNAGLGDNADGRQYLISVEGTYTP